jgi:mRNA-degrading endonuclease RelE of RelBE toxin-antitoxin system
MPSKIRVTEHFKKEFKRLSKKYASLSSDMQELVSSLEENPIIGTPLGNDVYKIRLAIKSKNKGKSGGARIITYLVDRNKIVYLLSIYDKSEKISISDSEIKSIILEQG